MGVDPEQPGSLRIEGPVTASAPASVLQLHPEVIAYVLKSHPLVHSAEGELYRRVFADASETLGAPAMQVPAKELRRPRCRHARAVRSGAR